MVNINELFGPNLIYLSLIYIPYLTKDIINDI